MTSLFLAAAFQISVATTGVNTYAEAREIQQDSGRPLVVLIGADWCPACQTMKNNAVPELQKRGTLDKVAFAYVNADSQRGLAHKMMKGGSIPQLVMFRQSADGKWKRERMVGAKSPGEIESFLNKGIEAQAEVAKTRGGPVRPVSSR